MVVGVGVDENVRVQFTEPRHAERVMDLLLLADPDEDRVRACLREGRLFVAQDASGARDVVVLEREL